MINPQKFVRKALFVDAVRATPQNFEEIASWCEGEIKQNEVPGRGTSKKYIKLKVHNPKNQRQTKLFLGDWLLHTPKGYKIYTNNAFRSAFDPFLESERFAFKAEKDYPYQDGPVLVLGPKCFIANDGSVLSWKGMNYVPQDPGEQAAAENERNESKGVLTSPTPIEEVAETSGEKEALAEDDVRVAAGLPPLPAEPKLPVDDSPEHRAAIERMKADAGIGEGAKAVLGEPMTESYQETAIPQPNEVVVDETTPEDMGLVPTDGPIASSSQGDRAVFENKDLGDPPTGESVQPGDEVAVKADEQARMAEGKRVLSIAEQAQMDSDEIRELLQTGEAVLAQDLVA